MTSGVLVVDKPAGLTSHAVVARVRKALGIRRIGHAGTLDPDATGVLVLGVGQATRLLGYLAASDKEYTSTFVLGCSTTTDDAAGESVAWVPATNLEPARVADAMTEFVGDILQRPSAVSAVKVDGQRAYALVRSGRDVDLPPRPVSVTAFDLLALRPETREGHGVTAVDVVVRCSAGTYIRALARDLGDALGVGGHVETLRRTRSGSFSAQEAVALADVDSSTPLLSPAEAARRSMPCLVIDEEAAALARHGVQIPWPNEAPGGMTAFVCGSELVGLGESRHGRTVWSAVFA